MSDFLGHLAARSLGRLETLQPRLPSRFEPAGPSVAPGLADVFADSDAAEGSGRGIPPLSANVPMAASRAEGSSPLGGRGRERGEARREVATPSTEMSWVERNAPLLTSPLTQPAPSQGGGTRHPALSAAKIEPSRLAGGTAAATAPPESVQPVEEPAPRRRRRTARPVAPDSGDAPEPAADRPIANRLASLAVPLLVANRLAPPAVVPAPPSPPPEPAANRLAPRSAHGEGSLAAVRLEPKVTLAPPAPAAAPPRTPPEPRSSVAPAPTIQVTIGRLEVRATPAPAGSAAFPRKAAVPQVTLAEYLDRRSRGGRR